MHPFGNLAALQRAAQQALVRRDVLVAGIAGSLFGVFALLSAIIPPLDITLIVAGSVLTVAGLWNLTNPHPIGILFIGASLLAAGCYNIASGFVAAAAGHNPTVFWQVLGFWQILWGLGCLPRYRRFARSFDQPSTPAERREAWKMLSELRRANDRKQPDVIRFEIHGFMPMPAWARLMPEGALCLIGTGDDVRVLPRDQISMDVMSDARFGRASRVRMRIADRILVGVIRKDLLQRFEAWKGEQTARQAMAA